MLSCLLRSEARGILSCTAQTGPKWCCMRRYLAILHLIIHCHFPSSPSLKCQKSLEVMAAMRAHEDHGPHGCPRHQCGILPAPLMPWLPQHAQGYSGPHDPKQHSSTQPSPAGSKQETDVPTSTLKSRARSSAARMKDHKATPTSAVINKLPNTEATAG